MPISLVHLRPSLCALSMSLSLHVLISSPRKTADRGFSLYGSSINYYSTSLSSPTRYIAPSTLNLVELPNTESGFPSLPFATVAHSCRSPLSSFFT
ncbi:hypothetical protein BGW80DRAFT_1325199 [Lactifluus volemus]|nr:hypothetical protein BGW80DRAFT_1325199 [Lactifluus volemus]